MWSADLSKSFSQLIVSIFVFSHSFFIRFCLVEKCGAKHRLNDFTSISIEFQYKRDLSVCSKLFIAFISLKWLVSPRCPIWHTFDSICYIYTSKVFKYISPLIFLKDSGYRVSFIAIMTHIKVVPNYFKFAIFDLKVLLVLIENDVKGQSLQNTMLYQLLAMLTELKHM